MTNPQISKRRVHISDCGQKNRREFRGSFEKVVADGDGGDDRPRVEGDDMDVKPSESGGAIGSDGSDHEIRDSEEEADVGIREGSDYVGVGIFKSHGGEFEGIYGFGH